MILHRIQPGPLLFQTNGALVWAMMAAYMIANVMMFIIMIMNYRQIAPVITIPAQFPVPVVFVFCLIGSYSVGNRLFDVWVMLGFGILGYCLDRARIPLGPFIIGFVLATPFEAELADSPAAVRWLAHGDCRPSNRAWPCRSCPDPSGGPLPAAQGAGGCRVTAHNT